MQGEAAEVASGVLDRLANNANNPAWATHVTSFVSGIVRLLGNLDVEHTATTLAKTHVKTIAEKGVVEGAKQIADDHYEMVKDAVGTTDLVNAVDAEGKYTPTERTLYAVSGVSKTITVVFGALEAGRGIAPPAEPPPIPALVYRAGGRNPGAFRPRPKDQGMLSVRDSLSNPYPLPLGQEAPLPVGKPIQVIETAKLPPGSVIPDGAPYGAQPPGHVSIGPDVPPEVVKAAVKETIPEAKTR